MASVLDKTPRVAEELTKYPRPAGANARALAYGTAGFREDASLLSAASHRVGMLAVLRSKREGKITGVMVTASHNPAADNGLKMIDSRGEMLLESWEKVRPPARTMHCARWVMDADGPDG
jgi:phosphoacetylglucosamine mutase